MILGFVVRLHSKYSRFNQNLTGREQQHQKIIFDVGDILSFLKCGCLLYRSLPMSSLPDVFFTAQPNHPQQQENQLLIFAGNPKEDMPKGLPFRLTDYLELVDWTGRILRDDKRGAIPENTPPILGRLNIETKHWLYLTKNFESPFKGLVGSVEKLKQVCEKLGYERTPGINGCKQYLPT